MQLVAFNIITVFFLLPSLILFAVSRIRKRPWERTSAVLGWRAGSPVHYAWALGIFLVAAASIVPIALFVLRSTYENPPAGTTLYDYARLGLSVSSVVYAFLNEFFFTALGEEVFFRGLLGGYFVRRLGFLVGNTLQAIVFLVPHLTVLLVDLKLWLLLIFPAILGWLLGWLRVKAASILPCMLAHALGNTFSDALAMWLG